MSAIKIAASLRSAGLVSVVSVIFTILLHVISVKDNAQHVRMRLVNRQCGITLVFNTFAKQTTGTRPPPLRIKSNRPGEEHWMIRMVATQDRYRPLQWCLASPLGKFTIAPTQAAFRTDRQGSETRRRALGFRGIASRNVTRILRQGLDGTDLHCIGDGQRVWHCMSSCQKTLHRISTTMSGARQMNPAPAGPLSRRAGKAV